MPKKTPLPLNNYTRKINGIDNIWLYSQKKEIPV